VAGRTNTDLEPGKHLEPHLTPVRRLLAGDPFETPRRLPLEWIASGNNRMHFWVAPDRN